MLKKRLIAVILVKDGLVVQSEQFKHTHVIHYDAYHAVEAFNRWSVDEIVVLNVSNDKQSQKDFLRVVGHISRTCFIPMAAGGYVDSVDYGSELISNGADKLVINTAWHTDRAVPVGLAEKFGSQCIVASIDVKTTGEKTVFVNRGMQNIQKKAVEWAQYCEGLGAGEIILNNIDHDGMRKGYDLSVMREVSNRVSIPVIAFGGVSNWGHFLEGFDYGVDAVAAANIFHYKELATKQAKKFLSRRGVPVRQ